MDKENTVADIPSLQGCLTCYLCGDIFRRPRILPCGHTFCSECLAKLKNEILSEGAGHCPRSELQSQFLWDFMDVHGRECSRDPEMSTASTGPSSASRTDSNRGDYGSSNVDTLNLDADAIVCCRPQFSKGNANRGSEPWETGTKSSNCIVRSSTFTTERPRTSSDRSPSRFSAPAGSVTNEKSCWQCGHALPTTPSRMVKISQRNPSFGDKSPKVRDGPRWDSSPQRSLVTPCSSFELKHGREMEQLFCPLPECSYSLRLMNLARWSPRNKAVADIVMVWRRQQESKQDASSQTEISTNESVLVTIPRSLVESRAVQWQGLRRRHSSVVDMALDSLDRGYLPRAHLTWRSYAAMVGMNILQQLIHF